MLPRFLGRLSLTLSLVALPAFLAPADLPSGSCAAVAAWAESYRQASPTLDELARLDRSARLAVLSVIAPRVRVALWREQLHRFSQDPTLTLDQRTVLREAITLVPSLMNSTEGLGDERRAFAARVWHAFPSTAHRHLWSDLGASTTVPTRWTRIADRFLARAATLWCNCSTASVGMWDCPAAGTCGSGANCRIPPNDPPGCGFLGDEVCNGRCGM